MTFKKCKKCLILKPLEEFTKRKLGKFGRRAKCKECSVRTEEQKQRHAEYCKNWLSDPKNYVKHRLACKQWVKANPGRVNAKTAKRSAAKAQRTPKWLTSLHFEQIAMFYDTASKLTKEFGIKMEVDHIVPLRGKDVSGLHVPWNLQVIPKQDNLRKAIKCL